MLQCIFFFFATSKSLLFFSEIHTQSFFLIGKFIDALFCACHLCNIIKKTRYYFLSAVRFRRIASVCTAIHRRRRRGRSRVYDFIKLILIALNIYIKLTRVIQGAITRIVHRWRRSTGATSSRTMLILL